MSAILKEPLVKQVSNNSEDTAVSNSTEELADSVETAVILEGKQKGEVEQNLQVEVEEILNLGQAAAEDYEGEVPDDVDALTESNDLTVIRAQLSSDELVNNQDIEHTESLIEESRLQKEYESSLTKFDLWDIIKKGSINLVLPFINGMMLGFGEILAHEIGFRYNWVGARVQPVRRLEQRQKRESKFL